MELLSTIHRRWVECYKPLEIKIKRGLDNSLTRAARDEFGEVSLFADDNADYRRNDFNVF